MSTLLALCAILTLITGTFVFLRKDKIISAEAKHESLANLKPVLRRLYNLSLLPLIIAGLYMLTKTPDIEKTIFFLVASSVIIDAYCYMRAANQIRNSAFAEELKYNLIVFVTAFLTKLFLFSALYIFVIAEQSPSLPF